MKHLVLLTIIFLFLGCSTSNYDKKENKRIVNELLVEFLTAVEKNDYDVLDRIVHDEFVIYENGSIWNLERLSTELENFKNVEVKYTLGNVHSIVDENVAHLQFKNIGQFVYPDTTIVLDFIESATFVKEEENWYLRFYHSTHLKRNGE